MRKLKPRYQTLIVGCGIRQVKQVKERCIAIDISQEYLDKAKEIRPDNIYVKASVENLPFSNNSFGKVIFTHVLEHVNNPKRAISEIHRILAHNGILFLAVPAKEGEDFLSKHNSVFRNFLKKYHKTSFNEKKIIEYLKKFKKVNIKKIKGKDTVFWWVWGKFISKFNLENQFYIEECGQIHSKKYDNLTRQLSRMLYLKNIFLSPFVFRNIVSEYQVIAIK